MAFSLDAKPPVNCGCNDGSRPWPNAVRRYFDRIRRKRGTALHDDTGFVSRHDAEVAVAATGDTLAVIGADIDSRKPKS